MNPLRVLAVDDEPLAVLRLEQTLARIPGVALVGSASGCAQALDKVTELRPDIVLLDIAMRDGSGFDLLERLPDDCGSVFIFVTAFDQFAVRAFETSAVDYVLKPVSVARLGEAIEHAHAQIDIDNARSQLAEMRAIISALRRELHDAAEKGAEFWIRGSAGGHIRVLSSDIEWIASEEDYVRLHTRSGSYLMRHSIRALLPKIDPEQFVRVHRRAIVRRSAIRAFHRRSLGRMEVELRSGARIAAGRVYAKQLRKDLLSAPPL